MSSMAVFQTFYFLFSYLQYSIFPSLISQAKFSLSFFYCCFLFKNLSISSLPFYSSRTLSTFIFFRHFSITSVFYILFSYWISEYLHSNFFFSRILTSSFCRLSPYFSTDFLFFLICHILFLTDRTIYVLFNSFMSFDISIFQYPADHSNPMCIPL